MNETRNEACSVTVGLPKWQLIDTAPKDHGDFLAWGDQHGMQIAYWACWFDNIAGEEREGWRGTYSLEKLPDLTHWQRLPAPPVQS